MLEKNIKKIVHKILNEESGYKVKSKENEQLRMVAQSLSSAKQSLKQIQSGLPAESGMESIIANTIKQLEATQKTFLGVKSYIK